jgi:hypothetical protein
MKRKILILISVFIISFVGCYSTSPSQSVQQTHRLDITHEHNRGNGFYRYYKPDGSLAWDTFYARWDDIPDSYYIYINFKTFSREVETLLARNPGLFNEYICFSYQKGRNGVDIIFSPRSFSREDVLYYGWFSFGQKRRNYRNAIETWNYIISNME